MRKLAAVVVATSLFAIPASAQKFKPGCDLPRRLADIAESHEIDDICAIDGPSNSSKAKKAESAAKNNFCATGDPVTITVATFKALQRKVDAGGKGFGKGEDRSELHDLHTTTDGDKVGEETLVRFAGFILDAHPSNVGKGEKVNCTRGGRDFNDIHIVIASDPKEKNMCNTVTAEMSPHM